MSTTHKICGTCAAFSPEGDGTGVCMMDEPFPDTPESLFAGYTTQGSTCERWLSVTLDTTSLEAAQVTVTGPKGLRWVTSLPYLNGHPIAEIIKTN